MKFGKQLSIVCAFLGTTSSTVWATTNAPSPAKTSFAYSISHTVKPLPASVIEKIAEPLDDSSDNDMSVGTITPRTKPEEVVVSPRRQPSRDLVCSAVASVAQANNLPIPFFANLIWQESSFDSRTISRAGAQGIAQFMPQTAVEVGLINPFEPIHALNVAGKFVSDLRKQFGNLGLAAAAYNAGPRRIADWLAKKGELPGETRNYVIRVTGKQAEDWIGAKNEPEMLLMPAKAPCAEVVEAVQAQTQTVRTARLISELATTASQMRDKPELQAPLELQADTSERGWRARVTVVVRQVLRRLEERRAAARIAAKGTTVRIAQRDQDDERLLAKAARRPEVRIFVPSSNRNAPKSTDKDIDRSAVLVVAKDESIDAASRDLNNFGKIDLSKSAAFKPEIRRAELVALGDRRVSAPKIELAKAEAARADAAKSEASKPDTAKADAGKLDGKDVKHAAPRRSQVVRFRYGDYLTRPF